MSFFMEETLPQVLQTIEWKILFHMWLHELQFRNLLVDIWDKYWCCKSEHQICREILQIVVN